MKTKSTYKIVRKMFQLLFICMVIAAVSDAGMAVTTKWDTLYRIPGQSTSASPALAVFNNRLYCVYKANDPSNRIYVTRTANGTSWSAPYYIPGQSTSAGPGLAVFRNRLYCIYKANDPSNRIYVTSTSNGTSWSSAYYIPGQSTRAAPSLAVYNSRLYCVYKANDPSNRIYVTRTSNGTTWSSAFYMPGQSTRAAPALAVFNRKLYCIYKANDPSNRIYVTSTSNGTSWGSIYYMPGQSTSAAPGVTVNNLYCVYKANDPSNRIYVTNSTNGSGWSSPYYIPGQSTSASPAIAVFKRLRCVYKANDRSNAIWVTRGTPLYHILSVPRYAQQTNMWCWAAGGEMIMAYLGRNVSQCYQANKRFNRTDCCTNFQNCRWGGWPEYPKYGFSCRSTSWGSALTFEQLQDQFLSDKPVGFAWGWTGGGGHYMVARGYCDYTVSGYSSYYRYVLMNDPWPWNANKYSGGNVKWITYSEYVSSSGHTTWLNHYDITKN